GAILHDRKRQTREDAPTVDQDRTGTALPVVAPFLRARQIKGLPNRVEERRPRRDLKLLWGPTQPQPDWDTRHRLHWLGHECGFASIVHGTPSPVLLRSAGTIAAAVMFAMC